MENRRLEPRKIQILLPEVVSLLFWKLDRDWKFNRRSLGKKGNFPFSNNYSSSRKIYDKIRFVNNNRGRGTEENEKNCVDSSLRIRITRAWL